MPSSDPYSILRNASGYSAGGTVTTGATLTATADQSARLAQIARDLIVIARKVDDPALAKQLSGSIKQILDSSDALSTMVIEQARGPSGSTSG